VERRRGRPSRCGGGLGSTDCRGTSRKTSSGCRGRISEDEEVDAEEPAQLGLDGVIEAGVLEGLEQPIGAHGEDAGPAGTGEVAEGVDG
jgi:hypothetical protein